MKSNKGVTTIEMLVIVALIGAVVAAFVTELQDSGAQAIKLKKDHWYCAKTAERDHTYPVMVGKVMIMQHERRDECVVWTRREY
ncbi:MAG: Flp family type IVb pilin [Pseudomonadota bacterium]